MTVTALPAIRLKPATKRTITYPESDGEPVANNTKQFRIIMMLEGNLEILFEQDPGVFVAGDLLWYPVEGNNSIRNAPDVFVAIGRPKGDRGSYLQWVEGNLPPQVIFEILSPGNRKKEMDDKFIFYERYGAKEYYIFDPDRGKMQGWLRDARGKLQEIPVMEGWRSPLLGIQFVLEGYRQWHFYYPDGKRFLTIVEIEQRRRQAEAQAQAAALYARRESARAEAETARAEAEAKKRSEVETQLAEQIQARSALEVQLRELEAKLRQAGLA